jgi:DNA-binding NtrC family response regulator
MAALPIEVLKLTGSRKNEQPKHLYLPCDEKVSFLNTIRTELPAVYLMREEMFDQLKKWKALFVERKKNPHKGLAHYCMGRRKIPVIRTEYADAGRALGSSRKLLETAYLKADKNIYFILVSAAVFHASLDRDRGKTLSGKERELSGEESMRSKLTYRQWASERMFKLLKKTEIPDSLKKEYIGRSTEIQNVHLMIMLASKNRYPVLIMGETGTGKEKIARAIHHYGINSDQPFVSVNCAAIPHNLFESELFGHEKGAFTGATRQKIGFWESAGKGTLFLDEIGDLPLLDQVKILRAIETRRFIRVGGTWEIKSNARVMAATNKDLFAMMKRGTFRDDLYNRLCAIPIYSPPLRYHLEDIPELTRAFWEEITGQLKVQLPEEIIKAFMQVDWPGNVRRLRSVLISLYTLFPLEAIRLKHLEALLDFDAAAMKPDESKDHPLPRGWKGIDTLGILSRTESVLESIERTAQLILSRDEGQVSSVELTDHLYHRIIEFVSLLLQAVYYENPETLSQIKSLGRCLESFIETLRIDPAQGLQFWQNEVSPQFRNVQQLIMNDIDSILARY